MTIRFQCDHCSKPLAADDRRAGGKAKCPGCGQAVVIPAAKPAEPPEQIEPVHFGQKRDAGEGLDMTPMVDVVFLLLIFFMVTAAFSLQKALEVPPPDEQEEAAQARTYEEIQEDDDFVIVRIDQDSTIWVDESEAFSEQDLLVKLREAREGPPGSTSRGPSSLLVMADGDARHEAVVMALDAGNAVGMESVRLATVDEEDL